MTSRKNPLEDAVEQALDAFVYAPIGLALDGPADFTKLVTNGKTQVNTARMMGQFAVQMGRTEVEKRVATVDGPLGDVLRGLGIAPAQKVARTAPVASATAPAPASAPVVEEAPAAPASKPAAKPAAKSRPAGKAAAKKAPARKVNLPAVGTLSIPDYDSLSASQVVDRLRGLAAPDLEAIRLYESAKRARKTVLTRISQLQK